MFDYHIYKVKYNIISHSNTPAIYQPYMILHIAKTNNNIEKVTKTRITILGANMGGATNSIFKFLACVWFSLQKTINQQVNLSY